MPFASVPKQARVLSIMPKIPEISVGIQMEGLFRFIPTRIFGIISGCGPLISVGIFQRPKFVIPVLTNWSFALIREFRIRIKSSKSHSYWLALFNRKTLLHFPWVFLLISDQLVWHNGKHPKVSKRNHS